jgi:hypothetical protein
MTNLDELSIGEIVEIPKGNKTIDGVSFDADIRGRVINYEDGSVTVDPDGKDEGAYLIYNERDVRRVEESRRGKRVYSRQEQEVLSRGGSLPDP